MVEIAQRRAEKLGLDIDLWIMDAETLAFPDERFNTVVSTLTLVPSPIPSPRSPRWSGSAGKTAGFSYWNTVGVTIGWSGASMDVREDAHAKQFGCH